MAKQFKGIAKDFINAMKTSFIGQGADPNKIIVQDLFTYAPKPQTNAFTKLNGGIEKGILDDGANLSIENNTSLSWSLVF